MVKCQDFLDTLESRVNTAKKPDFSTGWPRAAPNGLHRFAHKIRRLFDERSHFSVEILRLQPDNRPTALRAVLSSEHLKSPPLGFRKSATVLSPQSEFEAERGNITAVDLQQFEHAPPVLGAERPQGAL
jgi:hypothetical protein